MSEGPGRGRSHLAGEGRPGETVALLLIDVINALDFPGARPIVRVAAAYARRLQRLAARARAAGVPVVYVNDNFGKWRSDLRATVEHCLEPGVPGRPLALALAPQPEDYFVLKPSNSAFHGTTLDALLESLGAQTLVLTGIAGDLCVLFSANDAHARGYRLVVPSDGIVSSSPAENRAALALMRKAFKAATPISARVRF
jgi:nicotinamidase-related amidase